MLTQITPACEAIFSQMRFWWQVRAIIFRSDTITHCNFTKVSVCLCVSGHCQYGRLYIGRETTAHMVSSEVYSLFSVIIINIAAVNNNNCIYTWDKNITDSRWWIFCCLQPVIALVYQHRSHHNNPSAYCLYPVQIHIKQPSSF